ncbi:unnamed protein product [Haemonchus placei]|uniref:non-specific serine/threonine protein kinase n=1 Tax=Haemonchus placei TaxID=6290 RepID=A0A0N4WSL2_HAEPC|nr:unnamed protein product [Haemonchus placei]
MRGSFFCLLLKINQKVFSEKGPKSHNGYLFGAKIGEGSYAKVKEVIDETTLVRRAVKIIKHNRLRKIQNGQENVERELRILNKVKHENVIRLIEVFRRENKNKLYVVMEFCMGSVQQLLDTSFENRLSDADTHRYFVDLIKGLEYLHSVGIVHKDIKPANLLVSLDYTLKISDFGVAEELSLYQKDDLCQVVQGTPKFQAPELCCYHLCDFYNASLFSGFASDLWSCGVTLYNMISGLYPFEGAVSIMASAYQKLRFYEINTIFIGDYDQARECCSYLIITHYLFLLSEKFPFFLCFDICYERNLYCYEFCFESAVPAGPYNFLPTYLTRKLCRHRGPT